MAILLDFQKVREDSQEVEYAFGPAGSLGRRLVVEKPTLEARALDGETDPHLMKVLRKILQYHHNQGRWPDRGSYAA